MSAALARKLPVSNEAALKAANDSMAYWQKPALKLVEKPAVVAKPTDALDQMFAYFG